MAEYTAVVLASDSRAALRERFAAEIPQGWETEADHVTINLGPAERGPASDRIGEDVELKAVRFAKDDKVAAVEVEGPVPTEQSRPHVTLAVNRSAGASPQKCR